MIDGEYEFTIRPLTAEEGGGYLIEFPDLPGCMSDGETVEEAIVNGAAAKRDWIAAMREAGRGAFAGSTPLVGEGASDIGHCGVTPSPNPLPQGEGEYPLVRTATFVIRPSRLSDRQGP